MITVAVAQIHFYRHRLRVRDNRQHPPDDRLGRMSTGVPHLQPRCIDANKDTGDFVSVSHQIFNKEGQDSIHLAIVSVQFSCVVPVHPDI